MSNLRSNYELIKAESDRIAGGSHDIPRRACLLHSLYIESSGNHVFPLIAAHGALWAYSFFEVGGTLGRFIARRYFYNPRERAYRLDLLDRFANDFRAVNRQVFVDTRTNFHFTRRYGREPDAGSILPKDLLAALNQVHEAAQAGVGLDDQAKEAVFRQSLHWEQELTVASGVRSAVDKFECRTMKALCLMPVVRFTFFPRWKYLWFWNFTDTNERVRKGLKAFAYAQRKGWPHVEASLRNYNVLPGSYFDDPIAYSSSLMEST
jgi:hypothetical protein